MTYRPTEDEQRVIAWLDRGRPFPWNQPLTIWQRLTCAWQVLFWNDDSTLMLFKLLALKIEKGQHHDD
jgi:hypothetical protein